MTAHVIGATTLSLGKVDTVPHLQGDDPTLKPVIAAKVADSKPTPQEQQKEWFPSHGQSGYSDKLVVPKPLRNEISRGAACWGIGRTLWTREN